MTHPLDRVRFIALFLSVAAFGCGAHSTSPDAGKSDLAPSVTPDLVMVSAMDLSMPALAASGAPCAKGSDCGGTSPVCLVKDSTGLAWPGGYCTSKCDPQKNDPNDFINPNCAGGGTCVGSGTDGSCYQLCTAKDGSQPCRDQYLCFNWDMGVTYCAPTASSQCDPSTKGSCPQDGGSYFVTDGGGDAGPQSTYSGRTCERIGLDLVGICQDGCDVFEQNCNPTNQGQVLGCYASFSTGEGLCSLPTPGGKEGDVCMYLNGCDPGLGCYASGMTLICRPYCGGPKSVACTNGKKCVDLSMMVVAKTVGLCGG